MRKNNRFKYFSSNYMVSMLPRRLEVFKRPKWDKVQQYIQSTDKLIATGTRSIRLDYSITNYRTLRLFHTLMFQKYLAKRYATLLFKSKKKQIKKYRSYLILFKKTLTSLKKKMKLKRKLQSLIKAIEAKNKTLSDDKQHDIGHIHVLLVFVQRALYRLKEKIKYFVDFFKSQERGLRLNKISEYQCFKYLAKRSHIKLKRNEFKKLRKRKSNKKSVKITRKLIAFQSEFKRVNKQITSMEYFRFIPQENSFDFDYLERFISKNKNKNKRNKVYDIFSVEPKGQIFQFPEAFSMEYEDLIARGDPSKEYLDTDPINSKGNALDMLNFKRSVKAYYDYNVPRNTFSFLKKDKCSILTKVWATPFYLPFHALWYAGLIESVDCARQLAEGKMILLNGEIMKNPKFLRRGDILCCTRENSKYGYITQKKNFFLLDHYRMRSFLVEPYSRNILVIEDFNNLNLKAFWDISPQFVSTKDLSV